MPAHSIGEGDDDPVRTVLPPGRGRDGILLLVPVPDDRSGVDVKQWALLWRKISGCRAVPPKIREDWALRRGMIPDTIVSPHCAGKERGQGVLTVTGEVLLRGLPWVLEQRLRDPARLDRRMTVFASE
jgi:hypothetical protein